MSSTGNVYDANATRPALETDECSPPGAYGASKVAAAAAPRRWPDVGGAALPLRVRGGLTGTSRPSAPWRQLGLHPAQAYAVAHHRDIAAAVRLALTGVMDGRTVNVTDGGSPVTVYEMARLAGQPIEGSAAPLVNPWFGHLDGTVLRELGFTPSVPSVYAAARDGIL